MGQDQDSQFPPGTEPALPAARWNMAERVAFRFMLVYLILYILPFPLSTLLPLVLDARQIVVGTDPIDPQNPPAVYKYFVQPVSKYVIRPYSEFWDEVVVRTGRKVFDVDIQYRPRGSGDTTWNYVQIFDFAVLSAALALAWSAAAWGLARLRHRPRFGYPRWHEWLRVFVRFYLAQTMIVYGAMKVIKMQFAYPDAETMLQTYGESSPMRLLWTFMGASDGYTWFTGAGELTAGILLCTRRTTLLGALATFGVMIHVAALNYCYDVPVKLFSTHLVLMSLFLMVPDLPWLTRALVLGQPATARGHVPLVRRRWLDWTLFVLRTLIVVAFVGDKVWDNYESSKIMGRMAPEPPMSGLWEVEEFAIDGKTRPPLTTDGGRWQRAVIRRGYSFQKGVPAQPMFSVTNMRGQMLMMAPVEIDETEKTLTVSRPAGPAGSGAKPLVQVLKFTEVGPDVIELEGTATFFADGKYGPKAIKARLRHYGRDKFLLSARGFHWINEFPYNQYGPHSEPAPKIPPPPKRPPNFQWD